MADRSGLTRILRRLPTWRGVVILGYHRIGDPLDSELDHGLFSASAAAFDTQLKILARHFDVLTLDELEDGLAGRRGRAVLITFDDGYRDQATTAASLLRARGLPATFFLTTGFLDGHGLAWWDEIAWLVRHSPATVLRADTRWLPAPVPIPALQHEREPDIRTLLARYRELHAASGPDFLEHLAEVAGTGRAPDVSDLWMTWDQARGLIAAGMDVGGHTVTHPILARLDSRGQQREIAECLTCLEQELGSGYRRAFAYPSGHAGSFDAQTADLLRGEDVRWAFSFRGGWEGRGHSDRYDLRRLGVFTTDPSPVIAARVTLPWALARETL